MKKLNDSKLKANYVWHEPRQFQVIEDKRRKEIEYMMKEKFIMINIPYFTRSYPYNPRSPTSIYPERRWQFIYKDE
jgi:hypothetical protein